MSNLQEIQALVDQTSPSVVAEGSKEQPAMTTMRQLFTADWHQRLILAGYAYTLDLGTVAATAYTALTGNAAVDLDQPEIVIAIDSGWLVPMEIDIAVAVDDQDAYNDVTDMCFIADRAATVAAGITATIETANNLLDGGAAFAGRCYSICTGACGSPTVSDVLAYRNWTVTQVGTETAGSVPANKHLYKKFEMPTLLAGPCAIIGYVTGTNTPTFIGNVKFAHIPAANIRVS